MWFSNIRKRSSVFLMLVCSVNGFSRSHNIGRVHTEYRTLSKTNFAALGKYGHLETALNSHNAAFWAVGHVAAGTLGTPLVVRATSSWYQRIQKPTWTPPNKVFAPVWTTLYASMGIAASRVFQQVGLRTFPMLFWCLHMVLNVVWAPIFFGLQRFRLALWINIGLIGSLGGIIPLFYKVDPTAGLLLLPYMAWLVYATKLNQAICKLNPTNKGYNDAMLQADIAKLQKQAAIDAGC
jgi:tryptophan-rich sensory protein